MSAGLSAECLDQVMKILYLSCHSILEYDEVKLLHELGHEVFSPGAYVEPKNPGDATLRPGIPTLTYDPKVLEAFHKIGAAHPGEDAKNYLTKEFVDNFDCVIVMHMPRWISGNWDAMQHKRVIWRTIGQSVTSTERGLQFFRSKGLQVVRYSPKEIDIPSFIGMDALIRFYKDPAEFGNWNGQNKKIISFAQSMKQRDDACNYSLFERTTRDLPRALYGPHNDEIGESWAYGKQPFEKLQSEMRDSRVYFYTGTQPASYTLNFMEAWMTGIPIVAIGPKYGNGHWSNVGINLYEVNSLIENGVTGFCSDNEYELRKYCQMLLDDDTLAARISEQGRKEAVRHFGKDMIKASWKEFLDNG